MRLLNIKDPEFVIKLVPWFVSSSQSRQDIMCELYQRLKDKPDETFVCMAIENNIGQALLVAGCREDNVGIWQARARAGFGYQKLLLYLLSVWAKSKGYTKLTAGVSDKRRQKFFERKYGFKMCGEGMMEKSLWAMECLAPKKGRKLSKSQL